MPRPRHRWTACHAARPLLPGTFIPLKHWLVARRDQHGLDDFWTSLAAGAGAGCVGAAIGTPFQLVKTRMQASQRALRGLTGWLAGWVAELWRFRPGHRGCTRAPPTLAPPPPPPLSHTRRRPPAVRRWWAPPPLGHPTRAWATLWPASCAARGWGGCTEGRGPTCSRLRWRLQCSWLSLMASRPACSAASRASSGQPGWPTTRAPRCCWQPWRRGWR